MGIDASEILKRKETLKRAAEELAQILNVVDGSYEARQSEIKVLESKCDKLKDEFQAAQNKSNAIIQEATEKAATIIRDAKQLMDEALAAKVDAKRDKEEADRVKLEAQGLLNQVNERQRTLDREFQIVEERKRKLAEAMR